MFTRVTIALLLVASIGSALAATAHMRLPDGFREDSEFFTARNMAWRKRGEFQVAGYTGEYDSKESKLSIGEENYVSIKARASLVLVDPETGARSEAACALAKGTVNIAVVTFDPKKFLFDCRATVSGEAAQLAVGQAKGSGKEKLMAMDLRRGGAQWRDYRLSVSSVHDYQGSKFSSQAPVGYLIESGDRVIAAVELTDANPSVYLRRNLDADYAFWVMSVAMTLALMPAELE